MFLLLNGRDCVDLWGGGGTATVFQLEIVISRSMLETAFLWLMTKYGRMTK